MASGHSTSLLLKSPQAASQPPSLLSAYLLKQSAGKWKRKRWNQRWFVLDRDNDVLRYFRHASPLESVPVRQDAHGVLALKQTGVSLVVQGDLPSGVPTPFCFSILVDGQCEMRLCADNYAEFKQWTSAISAIISPSRTGARVGDSKVKTTSSVALGVEVPSSMQLETEVKVIEMNNEEELGKMEPQQVMKRVCSRVFNNTYVLIALNPVIVFARFGSITMWISIALFANFVCVWFFWFHSDGPRRQFPSNANDMKPASSTSLDSLKDKANSPVARGTASSAVNGVEHKCTKFVGETNGEKTLAGASLKLCSTETNSGWTQVDASRFNVRQGPNYRKTKLKAASAPALLELVAVDVYQSEIKAENVGSIVNLNDLKPATGNLDLFLVNCQVPSYQPSNPLWGEKQGNGPGFNFVAYFAIPPAIRQMLDGPGEPSLQAVRLFKDFMQPQSWVSERFKAIGIVVNPEEQKLGRAERRLLETYNGQPILTRPQHRFYRGDGYFEVDVDGHEFNYVARKGLVGVSTHSCNMILDFGFVLEGQEDHELPEQILGCVRLQNVDVRQAPWLY